MPSRQQKRRAKQREEYLQSRDDPKQKRASARDTNGNGINEMGGGGGGGGTCQRH